MLFFAHQSYNGSTSKFAIRPFTTKHGLFLDLFQILLTSLPFVVLSFELGCCYSFSLRRGGSYPLFGMYPTSLTVFHVHTDNLLLRVTALLLRVLAPITSCNSPITPPLRPPRLGPAVRSRTTEYPKWSSTISTPSNPTSFRYLTDFPRPYHGQVFSETLLLCSPGSATPDWCPLYWYVSISCTPPISSSFPLNYPLRHASSRCERRAPPDTERM